MPNIREKEKQKYVSKCFEQGIKMCRSKREEQKTDAWLAIKKIQQSQKKLTAIFKIRKKIKC